MLPPYTSRWPGHSVRLGATRQLFAAVRSRVHGRDVPAGVRALSPPMVYPRLSPAPVATIDVSKIMHLRILLTLVSASLWAAAPRPEFPEPQFQRELWQNLNGSWEFDFDDANAGLD